MHTERNQLHQPRIAEMVANILRAQILGGELSDGDVLPPQHELLRRFGISKPSLREALRILEAEGLVSVRRGNQGGAVVHTPTEQNAARTISLVLQSERVSLRDVGVALAQLEPLCAGLCAARLDRAEVVIPRLKARHLAAVDATKDGLRFTKAARLFHEEIVACCGNRTLILVVGALEALWSGREAEWAEEASEAGSFPTRKNRDLGNRAHARLLELIESGDVAAVTAAARRHLDATQNYVLSTENDAPVVFGNTSGSRAG